MLYFMLEAARKTILLLLDSACTYEWMEFMDFHVCRAHTEQIKSNQIKSRSIKGENSDNLGETELP